MKVIYCKACGKRVNKDNGEIYAGHWYCKECEIELLKRKVDTLTAQVENSTAFDKLVSTCGSIYMCRTQRECEVSAYNEINSGISRIKKGKAMLTKVGLNGQMKMKLGKYYKEAFECFEG